MRRMFAFVVLLCLTAVWATGLPKKWGHNDNIGEQWIAAWNSHDVNRVLPIFTEDVTYEDVAFGEVNHGRPELQQFATFFFDAVPDLKMALVDSRGENDHGTIEWVLSGTDKGIYKTGKIFKVRGVTVVAIRGGRIARNLDYYDSATIMRQVGLLPMTKPGQ